GSGTDDGQSTSDCDAAQKLAHRSLLMTFGWQPLLPGSLRYLVSRTPAAVTPAAGEIMTYTIRVTNSALVRVIAEREEPHIDVGARRVPGRVGEQLALGVAVLKPDLYVADRALVDLPPIADIQLLDPAGHTVAGRSRARQQVAAAVDGRRERAIAEGRGPRRVVEH